jgi:hypothetical protein
MGNEMSEKTNSNKPVDQQNPIEDDGRRIRRCTLKFECDMKWHQLQETNKPDIRFCPECSQNVYFVENRTQLYVAVEMKRCICIPADFFDRPRDVPLATPKQPRPEFEHRRMGTPTYCDKPSE